MSAKKKSTVKKLTARQVADQVERFAKRRAGAQSKIEELQVKIREIDKDLNLFLKDVPDCL